MFIVNINREVDLQMTTGTEDAVAQWLEQRTVDATDPTLNLASSTVTSESRRFV